MSFLLRQSKNEQYIQFTVLYDEEKQQICLYQAET